MVVEVVKHIRLESYLDEHTAKEKDDMADQR